MRTILKRNVRNVPVVNDNDTLVGLITRANLVDIVYDSIWGEGAEDAQFAAEKKEAEESDGRERAEASAKAVAADKDANESAEDQVRHDHKSDSGVER